MTATTDDPANPFDEFTSQAPVEDEKVNPFDSFTSRPAVSPAAARTAVSGDPDSRAKSLDLSQKTGLDPDLIDRNQAVIDARVRTSEFEDTVASDDFIKRFVEKDPENAKLIHDDVDALTRVADVVRSLPAGLTTAAGMGVSGIGDASLALRRLSSRGINSVLGDGTISNLDNPMGIPVPEWMDPAKLMSAAGEEIKEFSADNIAAPADRQNLATDISGGVGQVSGQIALTLINPGAALAQMIGQGADMQADSVDEAGADSASADIAILAGSGVTAISEKLGIDALLNRVPPAIKNKVLRQLADITTAGGIEAAQEVLEGIGHNLIEYAFYNPDAEIFDGLAREAEAAAGTGAVVRSIINIATKGRQVSQDRSQKDDIEGRVERLREMNTEAGQTKLKARAQNRLEDYIAEATDGESVYVDVDEFFQSIGDGEIDGVALLQKIGVDDVNIQEALGTGGDVQVSVAKLAAALDPDEFNALAMDIRYDDSSPTSREASGFDADMANAIDAMRTEMESEYSEDNSEVNDGGENQVFDMAYQQLIKAGMSPDNARSNAMLHKAFARVLGERYGEDALGFYRDDMGLRIQRQMPGEQSRIPASSLDLVIERALSGNRVKAGQPLIKALKAKGGIRSGSVSAAELAHRGVTPKTVPGLFSKNGIPGLDNIVRDLDTPFELLADDGNGYVDYDALIEAIDEEFRGNPVLTVDQQTEIAKFDDPADALVEMMERYVPDWNTMSRDEIKQLLEGDDLIGEAFNQYQEDPAFTEWFGDSKVVDENGAPLVVYHGTDQIFEAFDPYKSIGSQFWFTNKREEIEGGNVGAAGRGVIVEVHLSIQNPAGWAEYDKFGIGELIGLGFDGLALPDTDGQTTYVAFEPTQIKSVNNRGTWDGNDDRILYQGGDKARGSIQFGDNDTLISLFENSNASTFPHETGHFFLESLRYLEKNGNETAGADMKVLTDWFGTSEIGTDQHEQFARAFEAYLFEGKSPSAELDTVFERFAAWLMSIYKTMKSLNVEMNDDVRALMDRLLATDAEIEAAKASSGMTVDPSIIDLATEDEAQAIMASLDRADLAAKRDVRKKILANMKAAQSEEWETNYEIMREQVEDEVRNRPVYRAFDFLMGDQPRGLVDFEDDAFFKMSRADIVREYGKEMLKILPRGKGYVYTAEGGGSPDDVARIFGFTNAETMLYALADIKGNNWQDVVDQETQAAMIERYGADPTKDGTVEREAADAVVTADHANYMALEQKVLARKSGGEEMPSAILRETAIRLVRDKSVRIGRQVTRYLAAERKASRLSHEASLEGGYLEALRQKQRQILNHHMGVEAKKIRDRTDNTARYVSRMASKKTKTSTVDPEHIIAMQDLSYAFGFGSSTPDPQLAAAKVDRVKEWMNGRLAIDGIMYQPLPSIITDGSPMDHRDMNFRQIEAFRSAIKNIEHAGKTVSENERAASKIEFDNKRTDMIDGTYDNVEIRKAAIANKTIIAPTKIQKAIDFTAGLDAALLKVRTVVQWLDGDRADGAWHRNVFIPMQNAQTMKDDMTSKYVLKFIEIKEAMPKAWQAKLTKRIDVPEVNGQSMTWESLISLALNTGNQSNFEKLRDGYGMSDDQVMSAMSRLTAEDWKFVQETWDMIESLYPKMNDVHKRLTGVDLAKIEALPRTVETSDGQSVDLAGGYYPIVYDPRQSAQGSKNQAAKAADVAFEAIYAIPVTAQGHTNERSGFSAPLRLDLGIIPSHVSQVIHDIAYREVIREVDKLTQDGDVTLAVQDTLGQAYSEMFRPWLQSIANDRITTGEDLGDVDRVLRGLRNHTTLMAMGYKATTMFAQVAGLPAGMDYFAKTGGRKYLFNSLRVFSANPKKSWDRATEKSGMMRHRMQNMDREIRDGIRAMTNTGTANALDWFKGNAFKAIGFMDSGVSTMIWNAAYNQAIDQGMNEQHSIAAADDAVILTQGGGSALDLSAVQRPSSEAAKFLTMFYSYFSAMYSRERDMIRQVKTEKSLAATVNVAERYFWMIMIPSVMGELLAARWPDEEEPEAWAEWAAMKVAIYPLAAIPFARDIASGVDSGFGYSFTPAQSPGDSVTKLIGSVSRSVIDDNYDVPRLIKDSVNTLGYTFGLPVGQITKMGDALWRGLGEGEDLGFEEYIFGVKYKK